MIKKYNNMINVPYRRKAGMHLKYVMPEWGMNIMASDFREMKFFGGDFFYTTESNWKINMTLISDLNQYKAIVDEDKDHLPDDQIDPDSDAKNIDSDTVSISEEDTILVQDLYHLEKKSESVTEIGFGISKDYLNTRDYKLSLSGECAYIITEGLGFKMPYLTYSNYFWTSGIAFVGQTKHFLTSYFNSVYDEKRAQVVEDDEGNFYVQTKKQSLEDISNNYYGLYFHNRIYLPKWCYFEFEYQLLKYKGENDQSIGLELGLDARGYPNISKLKFFYRQDHYQILKFQNDNTHYGLGVGVKPYRSLKIYVKFEQVFSRNLDDGKLKSKTKFGLNATANINVEKLLWKMGLWPETEDFEDDPWLY